MLRADRALNDYVRNSPYNTEREKQLEDSMKSAWDEFVDSVASLYPEIPPRPARLLPLDSPSGEARDDAMSAKI
jgi:hypothetical protein